MGSYTDIADKFFVACEAGKGWDACKTYCAPGATFSAQAEPLDDVKTVQQYCDWMKELVENVPDARYELHSLATDEKRRNVQAYAVFYGTLPTGKKIAADYVYVMQFDGDKIKHLTKVWHSGYGAA